MDDLEFRDQLMSQMLYYLRVAYGDIPDGVLDGISYWDKMLCKQLGLDYDNIPDFDQ